MECLLTMLGKQHPRARCLLEHLEVDIGIAFLAYIQLSSLVEKMTMLVRFCGLTNLKIMKMLRISSDVNEVSIIPPDDHRVKKHRRGETGDDGLSSSHRSADVGNTFAPYRKSIRTTTTTVLSRRIWWLFKLLSCHRSHLALLLGVCANMMEDLSVCWRCSSFHCLPCTCVSSPLLSQVWEYHSFSESSLFESEPQPTSLVG